MKRIEIPVAPLSLNNAYVNNRGGGRFPSPELKRFHAEAMLAARRARGGSPIVTGPAEARLIFYAPSRRGDVDNFVKVTLDGITKSQAVWNDDRQVERFYAERVVDKVNPRVVAYVGEDTGSPWDRIAELKRRVAELEAQIAERAA